jgi:hypothetical protein
MPDVKEPSFFAFVDEPAAETLFPSLPVVRDRDAYLALYTGAAPGQQTGEASTVYLYRHDATIAAIRKLKPDWQDTAIVIVLRNPVKRTFSHYMNHVRDGIEKRSFGVAVAEWKRGVYLPQNDYVGYGFYYEQVRAYLEAFPRVHVVLSRALSRRTAETVNEIIAFLGIEDQAKIDVAARLNASGAPRSEALTKVVLRTNPITRRLKPLVPTSVRLRIKEWAASRLLVKREMDRNIEDELRSIYASDVERLEDLLGRSLRSWVTGPPEGGDVPG